jgi:hypothetical protein
MVNSTAKIRMKKKYLELLAHAGRAVSNEILKPFTRKHLQFK